jgi:hypothetical protein
MLASVEVCHVCLSVVAGLLGLLCLFGLYACVSGEPRKIGGAFGYGITGLIAIFMAIGVSPHTLGTTYKEVMPGVYQSSGGYLYHKSIPADAPVIYRVGNPADSHYTMRWWRWVNVVYVGDNYDFRVTTRDVILYRTDKEALLAGGKIVSLSVRLDSVMVNGGTDVFWRKDHYGQPQPGFEMLACSIDGGQRLEKWVFN